MDRNARIRTTWVGTVLLAAGLNAGCNDPNAEKITLLNEANARLMTEREQTQSELAAAQEDVSRLERQAEQLRYQMSALEGRLDSAPPEDWKGVPGGAMTSIPGSLLFDSGKAKLRTGAKATLDKIAQTIVSSFEGRDIYVFGHTDAQPIKRSKWRDNRQLSAERAMAVTAHLKNQGVSPERLIAAAAGAHRPAVEGRVAERRNRRVEIYAVTGMMTQSSTDRP